LVGFVNVSGSVTTQCPEEITSLDDGKYTVMEGDASYTYTFEKPILFSGYMIKTAFAEDPATGQPKDWTIKVNDLLEGGSDILIDEVTGEVERGPLEEKEYHIAEDKEVCTDSVTINITGRVNDLDVCEIGRFSILTS